MNLSLDALITATISGDSNGRHAGSEDLERAVDPDDVTAVRQGDLAYLASRGAHPLLIMRLARKLDIDPIAAFREPGPDSNTLRRATMHIALDESKCDGFASCVITAPELFELDDERGVAIVLQETAGEELRASAEAAAAACPMRAITIT